MSTNNYQIGKFKGLGDRIRAVRKALGLKQKELAILLGVTNGTLNRYEFGTRSPDPKLLEILAQLDKLLDCRWLLTGEGDMRPPSPSVGEAARVFAELTMKIDRLEMTVLAQEAEIQQYLEIFAGLNPAELDDATRADLRKTLAALKNENSSRRR